MSLLSKLFGPKAAIPSRELAIRGTVPSPTQPTRVAVNKSAPSALTYPAGCLGFALDQRFVSDSYPEMHYAFLNNNGLTFDCRGNRQFVRLSTITSFRTGESNNTLYIKFSNDTVYKIVGLRNIAEVCDFLFARLH